MITSPADKGLMLDSTQLVHGTEAVRAKVWDDQGVSSVAMQVDGGTAHGMTRIGSTQMWSEPYDFSAIASGDHKITVNVQGAGGNRSSDTILVSVAGKGTAPTIAAKSFGPINNSLGVYTEKGLLGNTGGPPRGGPGGAPGAGKHGREPGGGPPPPPGGRFGGPPPPPPGGSGATTPPAAAPASAASPAPRT